MRLPTFDVREWRPGGPARPVSAGLLGACLVAAAITGAGNCRDVPEPGRVRAPRVVRADVQGTSRPSRSERASTAERPSSGEFRRTLRSVPDAIVDMSGGRVFACPAVFGESDARVYDPGDHYHRSVAPRVNGAFRVAVTPNNTSFRLRSDEGDHCARVDWERGTCETSACLRSTALFGAVRTADGRRPTVPVRVVGCQDADYLTDDGAFWLPESEAGKCALRFEVCGEVVYELEVDAPSAGELDLGTVTLPELAHSCPQIIAPSFEEALVECDETFRRREVIRIETAVLATSSSPVEARIFEQLTRELGANQEDAYAACLTRAERAHREGHGTETP